jgi:hypothetical protein
MIIGTIKLTKSQQKEMRRVVDATDNADFSWVVVAQIKLKDINNDFSSVQYALLTGKEAEKTAKIINSHIINEYKKDDRHQKNRLLPRPDRKDIS